MKRWSIPVAAALLAVGLVQLAAAQGQGQGKGSDHGKGQGQSQDYHYGHDDGKDQAGYDDKSNHGQATSECNHQASSRNLKGQERKDFVEWCESRGARHKYDYSRYGSEKNCYQKANNKDLKGEKRTNFLNKCFAENDGKYSGDGKKNKD
jgi:hypothetical protein